MSAAFRLAIAGLLVASQGCSIMQGLRKDAYGDEGYDQEEYESSRALASRGRDSRFRKPLPAPVTVMDQHLNRDRGAPIDLSGVRAKAGRVTRKDFDNLAARNDNSLWREDGQTNYLFAANTQKMPGDLVTVEVDDKLQGDMLAEFKKSLSDEELESGVEVAGLGKIAGTKPMLGAVASAVDKAPELAKDGEATPLTGQAALDAAAKAQAAARAPASDGPQERISYTAEVVERYPNGNVLLRGVKRFTHGGRARSMEVTSIARASDINESNTVKSSSFYEHRTELFR